MTSAAPSAWIAYHLFHQGSLDRLLLKLVRPLVVSLWRDGSIDSFFFVRYGLGGPHVRLRLRCLPDRSESAAAKVEAAAEEFFRTCPSADKLSEDEIRATNRHFLANDPLGEDIVYPNDSAVALPFTPEVERYGGGDLLPHSLDLFALSSCYVLHTLGRAKAPLPRNELLSVSLRILARLALGLSTSVDAFLDLSQYAAVWSKGDGALFVQRGDQGFDRAPSGPSTALCREIETLQDPATRASEPIPLYDSARRLIRLIEPAPAAVRREIAIGHVHMTANRLGLINAEEIYLGRILWRAAERLKETTPSLWSDLEELLKEKREAVDGSLRDTIDAALAALG